LKNLLRSKK